MPLLPVMLKVEGRRCVILGGGAVACRRAKALLEAGAKVTVVAPHVEPELAAMDVRIINRPYRGGDLEGALLVVVATDDPAVNKQAAADAQEAGVLVNRADDAAAGDLAVPAHAHHGPVTLAVHAGGISARAAATIRRQLSAALDPDWPRLLETVAPYRAVIQSTVTPGDRRTDLLHKLTDEAAMDTLKRDGVEALRTFCRDLTRENETK